MAAEGIYELAEVGRYLRATTHGKAPPYRTVLRWVRKGLSCPEVINMPSRELHLNFEELVSLRMVVALRHAGFSLQHIRRAEDCLRRILNYPHPFAIKDLWISETDIFAELEHELLSASRHGQYAMELLREWLHSLKRKEFVDMSFEKRVNGKLAASSWTPHYYVSLDPMIQFGAPCIEGTRIPTRSIWFMVKGGDSAKAIASAYRVSLEKIEAALTWEQKLATE